ncbi:histidine kinase [Xanthomonas sp. AmX2]|uniref:sensor histidine kinase n=1 Tax=Xanthomonas sp. TaxID=29446 RepID=UPI001981FAEE|nr:histidine kinase [Xanthomonas sp.]MBN6149362.1 histidine kinase [Xanthomonas sp.]
MNIRLGSTEIGLTRYLSLWTAVVVAFTVQGYLYDMVNSGSHRWALTEYMRWSMIQWYTWAALAPLVFRLGERYPIRPPLRLRSLGPQLLASGGVTLLAMIAGAFVSKGDFSEQLWQFLSKHFAIGLLTYWGLLAIQQALHYRSESDRRELEAGRLATQLAQSRLQALKTQLQPHFLFNTLHAIVTLLDEDTASAEDMLLRLSELLRALLEEFDGEEITLRHELTLLDLYLGIQRKRFGDRLSTRLYIDPATLDCAVPSLMLQPIVENAIQHGIGRHAGADRVEIESRREDGHIWIEVRNRNSTLDTSSEPAGHGIGLSNTRLRLKELYGDDAQIRLDITWPQGVVCRVRLPFRELEDAEGAPEHVPA